MNDFAITALMVSLLYLILTNFLHKRHLERLEAKILQSYPNCGHKNWNIDTQIKIVWCEDCRQGNWYEVKSIEGRSIRVETK